MSQASLGTSGVGLSLRRSRGMGRLRMEGKMRTFVILLAATTGLLGLGYAFEANATMGVLQRPTESFSPVEKADCVEQGFFCPKGSTLQCDPLCVCAKCGAAHPAQPTHRHVKHT
jgi:hypothetical protein